MAKGKFNVNIGRRRKDEDEENDDGLDDEQDIEELKRLVEEARTNRPKDIKKKMKKIAKGGKFAQADDDDDDQDGPNQDEDEEFSDEERVLRELKAEAGESDDEDQSIDGDENGKEADSKAFENDVAALREIAAEIKLKDFAESLQVTDELENKEKMNPEDDKLRESRFQECAVRAVISARAKLDELKIPHRRPTDFMAEMIKSDDHMARVKRRLLFEQQKMKVVEARKSAERNKKRGKEIKKQKEQEKASKKRQASEITTSFRDKDAMGDGKSNKRARGGPPGKGKGGAKQAGRGGAGNVGGGGGGGGGGAKKRMGKNKRNSARGNRK